jgi:glycosyltransferase involved in cell wall biosynthesis
MAPKIKVLHIISGLMSGGAEAMLGRVARTSLKLGVDHAVVSMTGGGHIADELESAGIAVHVLGARRNFSAIRQIGPIGRIVSEVRPDVIQGWMYHGNLAATAAGRMKLAGCVPVIWNVRATAQSLRHVSPLTALAIVVGVPLSRSPCSIIYNSLRAADDHERLGYSRTRRVIIPNGFDTAQFRPDPDRRTSLLHELALPSDAAIIGRVANFHPYKDFQTLFDAFSIIAQADPSAFLVLVGRSLTTANKEFSKLLASASFADRIRIMGERSDVARIVPGFDILLSSSSSSEAFPNVIGEAMACGVPTITTDAGDSRSILGDPTRVANVRDPPMLAELSLRVLSLDAAARREIGKTDRERVIEHYSIEAVTQSYVDLWRQAADT